jgi:hypothetical protein
MATAAVGFGEHRFGAAYTIRILVVLGVLGLLAGLWAAQKIPAWRPILGSFGFRSDCWPPVPGFGWF